jgi:hypothetical protein
MGFIYVVFSCSDIVEDAISELFVRGITGISDVDHTRGYL